jgi:uncharacterized protein (DUF4415 family)
MNERSIIRRSSAERVSRSRDWSKSDAISDEQIATAVQNDPDAAPIADASFWRDATIVLPEAKERITIRLDREVLDHFRKQGQYQTRINAVLRAYVKHEKTG